MKQFLSFSKWPVVFLFTGLIAVSSCKKDNSANNPATPADGAIMDAAQSDASASDQFDDVFNITMGVQATDAGEDIGLGTGGGILYKPAAPGATLSPDSAHCYTVTVVPKIAHQFPKTVTIDFGDGCLGKDGKLRKGKIVSIFTGPMFIPGSKTSTTFINYSVDSFKIEGTHTIENTSTSNKQAWTVQVIGGKITNTQSGFWRKWDGMREHKQTQGNGTPLYLLDDVYEISGNATGSNSNGNSWKSVITDPLIRNFTCPWLVKGKVTITKNANNNSAILDYGDGSCDNKATVTINGVTHIITLH